MQGQPIQMRHLDVFGLKNKSLTANQLEGQGLSTQSFTEAHCDLYRRSCHGYSVDGKWVRLTEGNISEHTELSIQRGF